MKTIRWVLLAAVVAIVFTISGTVGPESSVKSEEEQADHSSITDYRKISKIPCLYKDELHVMLRLFKREGKDYAVIVNVNDLTLKVVEQKACVYQKTDREGRYFSLDELESSLYYKLLRRFNVAEGVKQNQGLTAIPEVKGAFLSIDMCPSRKKIETDLFNAISSIPQKEDHLNLLIAVSGLWITTHPKEFSWLKSFSDKNNVKITWVNHSFSHLYYKNITPERNFLLLPGTNMESEILETEKRLIERGELPSIFFRCPGLISDKNIADILASYGLVQLGASAWIAKLPRNHEVKDGDIVLVHGNGNEDRTALKSVIQTIRSERIFWKDLIRSLRSAYTN